MKKENKPIGWHSIINLKRLSQERRKKNLGKTKILTHIYK